MKHSVTWVSATCLEAVSPFLPKPQNAASSVCTEHPCKHPGVPLAWGEGVKAPLQGARCQSSQRQCTHRKGVAVSKKLYLQKQGWRAGLRLRVFADPSSRAPLVGQVENVPVKYGSFHLHK